MLSAVLPALREGTEAGQCSVPTLSAAATELQIRNPLRVEGPLITLLGRHLGQWAVSAIRVSRWAL